MNGIQWEEELTVFGRGLLSEMGYDPDHLPTDHNPVIEALRQPDFVEKHRRPGSGFTRASLSQLSVICQMAIYDAQGGPDGDGQPKGLRRQWYTWYKMAFAQPFAAQMGDLDATGQMSDLNWNARMSTTYASIVDEGHVTYRDLWVEDASRMMESIWEHLFKGCYVVVGVEKDSLFQDFVGPARSLGAASVYSGKGKSSKAGIERVLRDHFGWRPGYDPFSEAKPLIVLHVSDHDFDGEAVIGPTFAQQARRYTSYILEARVGIKPAQIEQGEWPDKWYRVKVGNTGYVRWAEEKALFMAECAQCPHRWPVQGIQIPTSQWGNKGIYHECPQCQEPTLLIIKIGKEIVNQPHGFEVEAKATRDYRRLLVRALLEVLPFDVIIKKLREECVASADQTAEEIAQEVYADNKRYQDLLEFLKRYDEVLEVKRKFEEEIYQVLYNLAHPHIRDWEDEEDDPEPEDYEDHVDGGGYGPWRPFSTGVRTRKLIEYVREEFTDRIEAFKRQHIEF